MKKTRLPALPVMITFLLLSLSTFAADLTLQQAMDSVVDRMRAQFSAEQLMKLDNPTVEGFLNADERQAFATKYWDFDANVPVLVSVMRPAGQEHVPFWFAESGFEKTDMRVRNEEYGYEVWQKAFPAGRVELGINGFEKQRPNYFVCVGPQHSGDSLNLSNFFPANTTTTVMQKGSFTYHDWPELVLTEVPNSLEGHVLLQTNRGRAREAHLVQAFRNTPYPSSPKPDQVILSWSHDPRTHQAIQWRTSPDVEKGVVRFKPKGSTDWREAEAKFTEFDDRLLLNDRAVHHFTAELSILEPDTTYTYTVGSDLDEQRSAPAEFTTAPDGSAPFSFIWMSDTHNSPVNAELMAAASKSHPDAAFLTISGDLVGTGQYRDDWDKLFGQSPGALLEWPFMPCIGNHDAIDGLGADLYLGLLALPDNGPVKVQLERAYSFQYSNALFIMLDVTDSIENQTSWLEEQLKNTTATWKFAVFHFPPYSPDDKNPDILAQWCPILEKYHVDFALTGHVHNYLRTHPIRDGKTVASPADGTIYMITISIGGDPAPATKPEYAAVISYSGTPLYQLFTIDGNRLITQSLDKDGKVHDELTIEKQGKERRSKLLKQDTLRLL